MAQSRSAAPSQPTTAAAKTLGSSAESSGVRTVDGLRPHVGGRNGESPARKRKRPLEVDVYLKSQWSKSFDCVFTLHLSSALYVRLKYLEIDEDETTLDQAVKGDWVRRPANVVRSEFSKTVRWLREHYYWYPREMVHGRDRTDSAKNGLTLAEIATIDPLASGEHPKIALIAKAMKQHETLLQTPKEGDARCVKLPKYYPATLHEELTQDDLDQEFEIQLRTPLARCGWITTKDGNFLRNIHASNLSIVEEIAEIGAKDPFDIQVLARCDEVAKYLVENPAALQSPHIWPQRYAYFDTLARMIEGIMNDKIKGPIDLHPLIRSCKEASELIGKLAYHEKNEEDYILACRAKVIATDLTWLVLVVKHC